MSRILRPRIALPVVVILALAGGGGYVYANQAPGAPQYRLASATIGTVTQVLPMSGNLTPVSQTDLDFGAAGRVASVSVTPGQTVKVGDTLATLDSASLAGARTQAQANLASAEARLSLDQAGPTAQSLASTQAQVSSATVGLANARAALADTIAVNQQAVAQAESNVSTATNTVASDQSLVNADNGKLQQDQSKEASDCNADPGGQACSQDHQQVAADQQKVAQDEQTLSRDQAALDSANNALSASQVHAQQSNDQAQAQVSTAQVQLQNAQAALKALEAGATQQQIQMDQAQVSIAQVNADAAQRALDQATLKAPVDGTVSAVNLVVGQSVSGATGSSSSASSGGATHAVTVLTPGAFAVTGSISDAQVGQVAIGQAARVTPAGSSQALTAKVTQIAPVATVTSGVATFPVTVTIDAPDASLHAGVSASVNIIVNQVVHVLTVPTSAVTGSGAAATVRVLENGQPVVRPVQAGASDSTRTEIISGLNAGDQVVIATVTRNVPTNNGNNPTFGGGGFFGGGPGGGGGGGGRFTRGGG